MKPYVIVLGNEKGGTGKSMLAMHIAVYLLSKGFKVGTIDIDARQGTFTHYFENRQKNNTDGKIKLSEHVIIHKVQADSVKEAQDKEAEALQSAFSKLSDCDFLVIDTPGNDTFLSQMAHSFADTLITPMNDSYIDLDVLVRLDKNDSKVMRPSIYAEMVWKQRQMRAMRRQRPIDWIVVRNRLSTLYTKNRKDINVVLDALSKRIGFRLGNGFCDRVIFRELFLTGLTLIDLEDIGVDLSLSHVSARQELRELINFMNLPNVK